MSNSSRIACSLAPAYFHHCRSKASTCSSRSLSAPPGTAREAAAASRVRLDAERLGDYAVAFREVTTAFGHAPVVSFTDVLRLPGVVVDADAPEADAAGGDRA